MKNEVDVIKNMQEVVEQMRLDDIEEDPTTEFEHFECDCCSQSKPLAGSIQYNDYRLCNDCVLLAEIGFELKRINDIQEFMDVMEDKRLENICEFINTQEQVDKN